MGEVRLAFDFLTNGTGQSSSSFHAAAAHGPGLAGNRRRNSDW
jgi:hypothetical protein